MQPVRSSTRCRRKLSLESQMFASRTAIIARLRQSCSPPTNGHSQEDILSQPNQMLPGLAIAIVIALVAIMAACGNSNNDSPSASGAESAGELRIIDSPRSITVDDLTGLGMKVGKEYDVATLEGATSASLLFWRVNGTAVEYEVRLYQTHADAVNLGTDPAQEGSGPDAIIDVDVATYKEGIRDRRTIFDFRAEPKPKYGAYGIYANMVMLCEGRDDAEAWTRCQALIDQLAAN